MTDPMSGESNERRARMAEYVPWILRDYFTNQGPSTAIVILLIAFLTVLPAVQGMGAGSMLRRVPEPIAIRMLQALVPALVFIGAFFATNGIVANDRKLGYYRFLFAKPVSPLAYYATTFIAYGAGLVVVSASLMGLWSATVRPMFPVTLLGVVALMYVAYGGLGLLLSAAWRFDWLSLLTVIVVASVAWSMWGDVEGPARLPLYLLPPVHRAGDIYALALRDPGAAVPLASVAWFLAYGVTCFAAALWVIRHRSLGTS